MILAIADSLFANNPGIHLTSGRRVIECSLQRVGKEIGIDLPSFDPSDP